jgi:hypothetical protein
MTFADLLSVIFSRRAISKRTILLLVFVVLTLVLLVGPQLFVFACEAGTGGAGCPK